METPQDPTPANAPGQPADAPLQPVAAPPPPVGPPPSSSWEAPADLAVGPAPGYVFGGAGERLVAYIVDSLIIFGLIIVVGIVGAVIFLVLPVAAIVVCIIGGLTVFIGYFPYFWVKSGQTPGLRMFGMRVVRDQDGSEIGLRAALLRLFGLYILDGLVFYIGFIWIFIDKRKRCWHDLIAGTVVVKPAS